MALESTGERFIPGMDVFIESEHFHRYNLAVSLVHGLNVLDLACGEGYGSYLLASSAALVTGVDISTDAISHAREKYVSDKLKFVVGDCIDLPFADNSFDAVVSFETIEHHSSHEEFLTEIRRVLRPNGFLIISSPNRPVYNKEIVTPNHFHVKELDFSEFDELLSRFFSVKKYYGQKIVSGSLISPLLASSVEFISFPASDENIRGSVVGIDAPVYFIGIAGNYALPEVGASILEFDFQKIFDYKHNLLKREAKLYFSDFDSAAESRFSEVRSTSFEYSLDSDRTAVSLSIPASPPAKKFLRLDISNFSDSLVCESLRLESVNGFEIWRWCGDLDFFSDVSGLTIHRISGDSFLAVCTNTDPQFQFLIDLSNLNYSDFPVFLKFSIYPFCNGEISNKFSGGLKFLVNTKHGNSFKFFDEILDDLMLRLSDIYKICENPYL